MNNYIAFWRPTDEHGFLGQWYPSNFEFNENIIHILPNEIKNLDLYKNRMDVLLKLCENGKYSTTEKYMMKAKAALFNDNVIFNLMDKSNSPKTDRQLGRKVKNFNEEIWNKYNRDIVCVANYLKFTQCGELRELLLNTGDRMLIEGSPIDKIWGVGMKFDHKDIGNKQKWKGTNYLGQCLEFVREIIKKTDA